MEGEASVFQRELKGRSDPTQFRDVKRKCLVAGRDFDHDDLRCVRAGGVGVGTAEEQGARVAATLT